MDALVLLKKDHDTVKKLFERFEKRPSKAVAEKIVRELSVHAAIEEQLFYPAVRQAAEQEQGDPGAGRLRLEAGGHEGQHEAHSGGGEPHGQEQPGEQRHPEPTLEDCGVAPLAELPDERAAEQRAVAGGVAVIEHRAAPANPAVHPGRVPGAGVDRRLEPGGRVGQGARTGEGH